MRFFKNRGLYKKLFISYILFIVLPFTLISIYTYFSYRNSLKSKIVDNVNMVIKQIDLNIQTRVNEIERLSILPYYNNRLIEILTNVDSENDINNADRTYIEDYLYNLLQYNKNIAAISIYSNNSVVYKGVAVSSTLKTSQFENEDWFKKIRALNGVQLISTHKPFINLFYNYNVISIGRALRNVNMNKYIGMGIIDLRIEFLDDIIRQLDFTNNVKVLIVDGHNNQIYSKNFEDTEINISDIINNKIQKDYFVVSNKSTYTDWKLFFIFPYKIVFRELIFLQYFTTTISVVSIIFAIFISYLVSSRISRRVNSILFGMSKLQGGDLEVKVDEKGDDELSRISAEFNKMVGRIKGLIDNVYVSKLKQKEAELEYLQSQINPHFLYNTLENIKMLGIIHEQEEIVTTAEALGKLLRYNVSGGKKVVSVEDELVHINSYLQIQKLRYGGKFTVNVDMDDEIRRNEILKFTLQPLVENAIHHGLETKKGKGAIWIRGYRKDREVYIDIIDNGKGIPKEKLDELNSKLDIEKISYKRSIGIFNVNERIKLFYGNLYGLSIVSSLNTGTTVTIILPYKTNTPNIE